MSLSLTTLDWIVCLVALFGSIGFGLSLALRRHSSESSATFFLAGRTLTWPIVGASLYATNIGAEHLVGLSGDAYRYGLCAGTVELCTCIPIGIAAGFLSLLPAHQSLYDPRISGDALHIRRALVFFRPDAGHLHHDQDGVSSIRRSARAERTDRLGHYEGGRAHGRARSLGHHHRRIYGGRLHRFHTDRHHDSGMRSYADRGARQGRRLGRAHAQSSRSRAYCQTRLRSELPILGHSSPAHSSAAPSTGAWIRSTCSGSLEHAIFGRRAGALCSPCC